MRRLRDNMMPGDMRTYVQDFDSPEAARKMARMMRNVIGGSKIHVRRGNRVVVRTHYSADAWVLTTTSALSFCYKMDLEQPKWLWKIANAATACARKHLPFYPEYKDGTRMMCKEVLAVFGGEESN